MPFSVATAVDEYVASLEVPREPDGTWHPSAIFGCPRKAIYEQRGTEPSNPISLRAKRIFRVGHLMHEFIEEAIRRSPDVAEVHTELAIEVPDMGISGHFDGLVRYHTGTWELLEFKTISSKAFGYADLPKPEHEAQASVYMKALREYGATGADGTIVPPLEDLTRGRIVYVSKDDLRIEECALIFSPAKERTIRDRVVALDSSVASGVLPPRLPLVSSSKARGGKSRPWQCGYCQFEDLCWEGPE